MKIAVKTVKATPIVTDSLMFLSPKLFNQNGAEKERKIINTNKAELLKIVVIMETLGEAFFISVLFIVGCWVLVYSEKEDHKDDK